MPGSARRAAAVAISALGAALLAASAAPLPQEPARGIAFSHRQHVPAVWFDGEREPETQRDCRGCHRFEPSGGASSPQQLCAACHYNLQQERAVLAPLPEPAFAADLSPYRTRTSAAFRHAEHAALACRECHAPEGVPGGGVREQDHLPIRTGPTECARCHDAEVDQRSIDGYQLVAGASLRYRTPAALQEAFAKGLNGGRLDTDRAAGQPARFQHRDHATPELLASGQTCLACHQDLVDAAAGEQGLKKFTLQGCGKCHRDEGGAALAVAPGGNERRPSFAVGTFGHSDHLAAPAGARVEGVREQAHQAIQRDGCVHCHRFAARPETAAQPARDFAFAALVAEGGVVPSAGGAQRAAGAQSYAGCGACHEGPRWRTQEGLHGGWQRCTSCHVFGGDLSAMKTERPSDCPARARPRAFAFQSQAHPHVSAAGNRLLAQSGGAKREDCRDCHVAGVESLPSRIGERAFRHDTHLPAPPTSADCKRCHPQAAAAAATSPAALAVAGGREPAPPRTWSPDACAQCHFGDPVVEVETRTVEDPVPRFAHADHVGRAQSPLPCTDCHALAGDGVDVETLPDALACAKCHDHGDYAERTGRVSRAELASCGTCHRSGVPRTRDSEPAADDALHTAVHATFGGFAAGQHHPAGRRCDDCHVVEPRGPSVPLADHVASRQQGSAHADPSNPRRPFYEGTCIGCHWRRPKPTWSAYPAKANPEDPLVRSQVGGDLEAFPGPRARDFGDR
jgi:hypothetical protein